MPERPDLEYAVKVLRKEVVGLGIAGVRVKKPVVLRVAVPGKIDELLVGRTIGSVKRMSHFVLFALGDLEIAVSPMLAGRFALAQPSGKQPADLALALDLSDGSSLQYRDDVQMGKVYVIRAGTRAEVPGLGKIGLDALDPRRFTREAFRALAARRRDQVKVFLMDKAAIDSMGNAYADEVLWEARIHPKAMVRSLGPEQIDSLHDAIVKVLGEARDEIARRAPPIEEKVRDFLAVRGRHGEPCRRCGTKIRSAGVHGHDADMCPTCQPDHRGKGIVDWRKLKPS
ncbi:MAG: endonuclease VIII [Deltaproteobacteria bacterium]|nr:endonuclease VIII [Deltaproteobacteria bacterium]